MSAANENQNFLQIQIAHNTRNSILLYLIYYLCCLVFCMMCFDKDESDLTFNSAVSPRARPRHARSSGHSILLHPTSASSVSYDLRWTVVCIIRHRHRLPFSFSEIQCATMATLVANRAMDVNGLAAAARTHTQAVTRNYISQPRLSM